MSLTKLERDKQKLVQDKCQQILTDLLRDEDNKYCVDCDSKGPRWASWNLGIFLCIRCAGIHRNLGVHISKVKSVNLDSWTPEQVGSIQNMGNSKARAVYEANLPDNFSRPQGDTALESFIRAKYEHKKYIAKEWVETPPKPAFDVETELKKEKEKKKSKIKPIATISSQNDIQSNPIPRPTASTTNVNNNNKVDKPKMVDSTSPNQQQQQQQSGAVADLLSLDLGSSSNNNNEAFGIFASATTDISTGKNHNQTTNSNDNNSKSLDDEEKDFFNQKNLLDGTTFSKTDEKKMTKESILSLYSQTPTNALNGGFHPSSNQFNASAMNPLFAPANQTNLSSSTNPFLTNNHNSSLSSLMSGTNDFHQSSQSSLIPGLSSLNLQSSQMQTTMIGTTNTQQSHLNWFNAGNNAPVSNTNPIGGVGLAPSKMANPFLQQSLTTKPNGTNNLGLMMASSINNSATSADKNKDNINLW